MKKLTLTAIEPEDLDLLYTIENDPYMWLVGNTNVPYSRYALRDYIAHQQHDIYADGQVRFVIRAGEKAVGLIDLFDFSPRHCRAEMGIAILESERRKGYSEQAIAQLLRYSDEVLHLRQVYSIVAASNEASLSMLRKTGFTHNATLKEWLRVGDKWQEAVVMSCMVGELKR